MITISVGSIAAIRPCQPRPPGIGDSNPAGTLGTFPFGQAKPAKTSKFGVMVRAHLFFDLLVKLMRFAMVMPKARFEEDEMSDTWKVYCVKYAERNARTRADSFIFDDHPAQPHGMDYFVWVLDNGARKIVVDTGYDTAEARRRARPILRDPAQAISAVGVDAETVDTVIITHLHYDHAGGLERYPKATFHLQSAEMAYATGPCMCHDVLKMPFTAEHVCEMVRHVYSGRVVFHDGSAQVAPGVRVHCVGGHSRGLQVVEVDTENGPLCLASDASHYYENFVERKPFPIVADVEAMLTGFETLYALGKTLARIIPGHDPLVTQMFPQVDNTDFAWRLDAGPDRDWPDDLSSAS